MAVTFIQVASATLQITTSPVVATFTGVQTPGNLNVVIVGWNAASGTVSAVTDSYGNDYFQAIAPFTGNALAQAVWYAPNIVGAYGNLVAATLPYRNLPTGRDSRTFRLFMNSTALDSTKTLASVVLPVSVPANTQHVFSIATDIGTFAGDPLSAFRNNLGISHDATTTQADLDGGGNSYSYEAFQALGIIPGGTVTSGSITFPWANVNPGVADNVTCNGQVIAVPPVPGALLLGFLGTAVHGNQSAWGTLTYTDGTSAPFALGLTDWFNTVPTGNNAITVALSVAQPLPDLRILEYSGVATASPFDTGTSATGVGTNAFCGNITTAVSNELLVAGGMTSGHYSGAGAGMTSRVITSPNGDIAEDETAFTVAAYGANGPLTASANWLIQLAAFKPVAAGVILAHATLSGAGAVAPSAQTAVSTTYLRRALTPVPSFNLPFTLPGGYVLTWGDTTTGAANGGAAARPMLPGAGSAEVRATIPGTWTPGSTALAQYVSVPLAAQAIPSMTWQVGVAMASTQTRWTPIVGLALINGATGALKTTILAPTALGATARVSPLEQQCLATLGGAASATAAAGDYLALEVGAQLSISPANLSTFVGNKGIVHDAAPGAGNFDLTAFIESYSYEALQAAGVTPGAAITAPNGITYFWPNVQPGSNDNVVCAGQVVPYSPPLGASAIGFLGAAVNGNQTGTCTLKYTDTTTTTFTLGMTDWASTTLAAGNTVAVTTAYRDVACNTGTTGCTPFQQHQNFYVFAASAPLDTTRTLASVTLPNVPNMRVFGISAAIGVETAVVASDGATAITTDGGVISGPASFITSAQPLAYLGTLAVPGGVLAASGTLTPTGTLVLGPATVLPATGRLTANGTQVLQTAQATLVGSGTMPLALPTIGTLISARGALAANATLVTPTPQGAAVLAARGTVPAATLSGTIATLYLHATAAPANGTIPLGTVLNQWATCTFAYDGLGMDPIPEQGGATQTLVGTPTTTTPNEIAQFVSGPLAPGQNLGGNFTVGFGIVAVGANQTTGQWALAVIGFAGQVQSVLLTPQAASPLTGVSGTLAVITTATAASYVTVPGDRLVLEIGGVAVAGASDTATSVVVDGTTPLLTHGQVTTTPQSFLTSAQPLAYVQINVASSFIGATGAVAASSAVAVPGSATLAAVGSFGPRSVTTVPGNASLAGVGALVPANTVLLPNATCTLVGTGALSGLNVISVQLNAAISALGTLTANGTMALPTASASLSGTASLSAIAANGTLLAGTATLTGNSNLALATASGPLSATGTLTASAALQGAATIGGTGGMTIIGGLLLHGNATLPGVGTLTGTDKLVQPLGASTLAGTGTLAAVCVVPGVATLAGTGALPTAFANLVGTPSALLSAVGGCFANNSTAVTSPATLAAVGGVQPNGGLLGAASAAITGTGTLVAATLLDQPLGSAVLSGTGTVVTAQPATQFSAVLAATGTVVTAQPATQGAATLPGVGTLVASATTLVSYAASLAGVGTVTPAASLVLPSASASLAGLGTVVPVNTVTVNASATLDAVGGCFASARIDLFGTATLEGAGALLPVDTGYVYNLASATLAGAGALPVALADEGTLIGAQGSLNADGVQALPSALATLAGVGSVAALAAIPGQTVVAASGSITASGGLSQPGGLAMAGVGAVTADGSTLLFTASGPLGAVGTLTADGAFLLFDTPLLTATGTLTAASNVALPSAASVLVSTGTLTADGIQALPSALATLAGVGSVPDVANSTVYLPGAATLAAVGALADADGEQTFALSATPAGTGTLTATGIQTLASALAALDGTGTISGALTTLVFGSAVLSASTIIYAYLDPPHTPVAARIQVNISAHTVAVIVLQPDE